MYRCVAPTYHREGEEGSFMTGREHMPATTREGEVLRREPSQVLRLFTIAVALVAGLAIVLGAMLSAAQAAPVGALKQFRVPTDNSQPRYITEGTDGNFWFTEGNEIFTPNPDPNTGGTFHRNIGRITPAGVITEFRIEDGIGPNECSCLLNDIVQGPGGVLYFTTNNNRLGRITTAGTLQSFIETPFPVGDALARHDDDLWISDFNARSIWRYNITNDHFTEFPISNLGPSSIAVDQDGIVWFADAVVVDPSLPAQGVIGRLDPADGGAFTTFNVDGLPRDVSIATDGAVWFTERFTPQGVGRLDPATGESTVFAVDGGPEEIAPAAGGSMWFTRTTAGNIARITPDGIITAQSKSVKGSQPFGITVASNGNPWFTMMSANKVATFQLR
jgi:streptogramin lyase